MEDKNNYKKIIQSIDFQKLSKVNIEDVDIGDLKEITEIKLDPFMSPDEKLAHFLCEIKNPYCFLCNSIPVKINFDLNGKSIEESLKNFIQSMEL